MPKAKNTSAENPWNTFTIDNGPWQELTTIITGRLFNTTVVRNQPAWYPTAGRRSPNAYFSVYGTHGQYWTTSVTNTIGNIFNLSSSGVNLDITNHQRSYGFPVRCIRE